MSVLYNYGGGPPVAAHRCCRVDTMGGLTGLFPRIRSISEICGTHCNTTLGFIQMSSDNDENVNKLRRECKIIMTRTSKDED